MLFWIRPSQISYPGFLTLHSAFKDALVRKVGIVKFWWDEIDKTSTHSYTGVDAESFDFLQMEEGSEIVEREMYPAFVFPSRSPSVQPVT